MVGRYDSPIPTWFLAPIDCLKIPAQVSAIENVDANSPNISNIVLFAKNYVKVKKPPKFM
jgi:hypothetical protein